MKTDDLVRALAADAKQPRAAFDRFALLALAGCVAVTAVYFFPLLGLRPDFAGAVATPRFLLKLAVVTLLAVAAAGLLLRAGRPGAQLSPWLWVAAAALATLVIGVATELSVAPPSAWLANLRGSNWLFCLTVIPALALAPLAIALGALRYGAPTSPKLAGAIAGLAASGIAAVFYALNCDNDSPLFVATWYSLAIGFVVLAGSFAGSRLLRW
ncbi:MAG: DUF1109 family protein [Rhizobiales bacterium]|nr:DUF1109 family protein [Hyphomicrobiales bacterium]